MVNLQLVAAFVHRWPLVVAGWSMIIMGGAWFTFALIMAHPWLLLFAGGLTCFALHALVEFRHEGLLPVLPKETEEVLQKPAFELLRDALVVFNKVVADWVRLGLLAGAELDDAEFRQILSELDSQFRRDVFQQPAIHMLPCWAKSLLLGIRENDRDEKHSASRLAAAARAARILMRESSVERRTPSVSGMMSPLGSPARQVTPSAVPGDKGCRTPVSSLFRRDPQAEAPKEEVETGSLFAKLKGRITPRSSSEPRKAQVTQEPSSKAKTSPRDEGVNNNEDVNSAEPVKAQDGTGEQRAPEEPAKPDIPEPPQRVAPRGYSVDYIMELINGMEAGPDSKGPFTQSVALRILNEKMMGLQMQAFKQHSLAQLQPVVTSACSMASVARGAVGAAVTAPWRMAYASVALPFRVGATVLNMVLPTGQAEVPAAGPSCEPTNLDPKFTADSR